MPSIKHTFRPLRRHYMKEWRIHAGLDQEQAASRIGISRSQLSKIENMKSPYVQGLLEAAAVAYNCRPPDLLMRNPADSAAPWSILDSLEKAPEPTRRQIAAVLETLLKTGT